MSNKVQEVFQKFVPYLVLGLGITVAISFLILFSYLLMWGILLGAIIWAVVMIKNYFFRAKSITQPKEGRIIEHDDKK